MLYHYTSLETLAMILESKCFAFNKLSSLDDPLERYVFLDKSVEWWTGKKNKRIDLGDFCYVSCWSDSEEESIAMWDMYGDRKEGVRIGLPEDMFDKNYDIHDVFKRSRSKKLFQVNNIMPELIRVNYNFDEATIHDGDYFFDKLGRYKTDDWAFQKECRFRLFAFKSNGTTVAFGNGRVENSMIKISDSLIDDKLFFKLSEVSVKEINILRGPKMNEGKRILFEGLADKYNINRENISDSCLFQR